MKTIFSFTKIFLASILLVATLPSISYGQTTAASPTAFQSGIRLFPQVPPRSPDEGQVYQSELDHKFRIWNGTYWQVVGQLNAGAQSLVGTLAVDGSGLADWVFNVKADDLTGIQVLPSGSGSTALHMGPGLLVYASSATGIADFYSNYRKSISLGPTTTSSAPTFSVNGPMSVGITAAGNGYIGYLIPSASNGSSMGNIIDDLNYNLALQISERQTSAPVVAQVVDGTGLCTAGTHVFALTVKTAGGEARVSPASSQVTCDGTHTKVTVTLPVGTAFATARNVYVSKAGTTSPLYLVASNTVNDNTTTSYTFNTADASLTATVAPTFTTAFDTRFAVNYEGGAQMKAIPFAKVPGTPTEGMFVPVTDSLTAVWGATITGGGSNHVLAYYNGTNWTVSAK